MTQPRVPALDGIRAMAVLAVIAFHAHLAHAGAGWLGVDVFYVLSGYLITGILLTERERAGSTNLRRFWLRRIVRLYPALVLAVALAVTLSVVEPGQHTRLSAWSVAAALTYTTNIWWAVTGKTQVYALDHTWSLAIEEQFYILWPLAVMVLKTRRNVAIGAIIGMTVSVISMLTVRPFNSLDSAATFLPENRGWELLAGCLLAALVRHRQVSKVTARWMTVIASIAAIGAVLPATLHPMPEPRTQLSVALAVVSVVCLLIVLKTEGWVNTALSLRPLPWIGQISYGLYLYHYPVVIMAPSFVSWRLSVLLPVEVALLIVLAWLSFQFIERPLLNLTRRQTPGESATEDLQHLPHRIDVTSPSVLPPHHEHQTQSTSY